MNILRPYFARFISARARLFPFVVILLIMIVNLALGIPRLGTYSAVDEPYWTYDRTPQFWDALLSGEWKRTDVNDKPGITVATLSGLGLPSIENPLDYKDLRENPKTAEQLTEIRRIDRNLRIPIFVFAILSLPIFFLLLRKALGSMIALLATIMIGLSPILLGMSLIINPDSLLWIFFPLALLARIAYGRSLSDKHSHTAFRLLLLTGFLTGLALLTKYVANILFVFFFIFPFVERLFSRNSTISPAVFLRRTLRDFGILAATAMATFAALFPAVWAKDLPLLKKVISAIFHFDLSLTRELLERSALLQGTFLSAAFASTWPFFVGAILLLLGDLLLFQGRGTDTILTGFARIRKILVSGFSIVFLGIIGCTLANSWFGMRWYDFEEIVASPKNSPDSATIAKSFGEFLGGVYGLIFAIHPIVLLGLITAFLLVLFRRLHNNRLEAIVLLFGFFILFYYAASTLNYVTATVRYQIALYPLAFILAAIGFSGLIRQIHSRQRFSRWTHSDGIFVFATVLIIFLIGSLIAARPFYLTYASPLLPEKHVLNYKDMGDGSYEAAEYLNALPHAQDLVVWSDKGAVCAIFVGKCSVSFNEERVREHRPDYLVLSVGRKRKTIALWNSKSFPYNMDAAYHRASPVYEISLGNRSSNFVRIVRADDVLDPDQADRFFSSPLLKDTTNDKNIQR